MGLVAGVAAVKALNDVLGIYVGGKEVEREDQKAINLAAAKRAFDLEDAETASCQVR